MKFSINKARSTFQISQLLFLISSMVSCCRVKTLFLSIKSLMFLMFPLRIMGNELKNCKLYVSRVLQFDMTLYSRQKYFVWKIIINYSELLRKLIEESENSFGGILKFLPAMRNVCGPWNCFENKEWELCELGIVFKKAFYAKPSQFKINLSDLWWKIPANCLDLTILRFIKRDYILETWTDYS